MAEEFGARQILDIGCGTGVFALLLADRGVDVVGIDPARASIDVARAKPGSERVRWICGDATWWKTFVMRPTGRAKSSSSSHDAPDPW